MGKVAADSQAHLFPQNVPQHGCEAAAAAVDPLCEAVVFQEHSCALFHVGIRSLLQIRDFFLCIWERKFESPLFLAYCIWLGIQCCLVACYTACVLTLCHVIVLCVG